MNTIQYSLKLLLLVFLIFQLVSCTSPQAEEQIIKTIDPIQNKKEFVAIMQKHLDAVSNKDLKTLASTMAPSGKMQLILPGTPITDGVDGFLKFHEDWFVDSTWTFETKILNTEVGENMGIAVTEVVYREPERDGKPYFNKMIVSYGLEKMDGTWCIIKDHASSMEKSTDGEE